MNQPYQAPFGPASTETPSSAPALVARSAVLRKTAPETCGTVLFGSETSLI
ncbi:MAG: hypothetical protein MUC59_03340 [Saprospiraceae bacterium]|nr:hypothetical protein [Saprospiraceae bacterium]